MGLIIFSDLDGTLLDHDDYSWQPALAGLQALRRREVPLILCSSKTLAEMASYHQAMGLSHPLVYEGGGGLAAPRGHALTEEQGWQAQDDAWMVKPLGSGAQEIRRRFALFQDRFQAVALTDLSDRQVVDLTGLNLPMAALAKRRQASLPVILPRPEHQAKDFIRAARQAGLQVAQGSRFFHLLGNGGKGEAVGLLIEWYGRHDPDLITAALGDSPHDLPMLEQVDHPILVARPHGDHVAGGGPLVRREKGVGPQGWNRAVLALLGKEDNR